ncbi:MAG: DUF2523 family protein [Pseudoalteromonas sp.]|uniref:DUF2523 family protein n=1 Tax=Pseudoalteromonas sp. TaxID=53249 RepID=UPI00384A9F47
MNKIILGLILLTFSIGVYADDYQGIAGFAQSVGYFFTDIWDFFENDAPKFLRRTSNWIITQVTLFQINAQIETTKLAWGIAKSIAENFQIGSKIATAANALPQDVQAALVDMRLFDGVNIIVQALIARYVLRFI